MNVPSNLELYRQITALEYDAARNEMFFNNLDHSPQRALLSIAHSRNFEYEYHQGCARVFRRTTSQGLLSQSSTSASNNRAGQGIRVSSTHYSLTMMTSMCRVRPESNSTLAASFTPADLNFSDMGSTGNQQSVAQELSSPFMDFSGVQQKYGSLQQQPETTSDSTMESTYPADVTIPMLGTQYF